MEKIIYPLKNMWITQIYGVGSHKYCKAIDDQGKNYATIDKIYAPFTGKVVRKYPSECEIWFESVDKVEFADGTIDYATVLFAHKDKYDDIKENVVYKQGEVIYSEGTKALNKIGGAQRHVHFEIQPGKTTGSGWVKAKDGSWNLPNGKKPEECYFIDSTINVIKNGGLNFKSATVGTPIARNENVDQIEIKADALRARKEPSLKGAVLGYTTKGIYNILDSTIKDDYTWYEIEEDTWVAYNEEWETLLPRTKSELDELKEKYSALMDLNTQLENKNYLLEEKLNKINDILKM